MKQLRLIPAIALLFALTGCGTVKIRELTHNPARYQNRTVNIEGNVTGGVGALVAGGYQVDDGTGKIIVVSTRPIPPKGANVRVAQIFGNIAPQSFSHQDPSSMGRGYTPSDVLVIVVFEAA